MRKLNEQPQKTRQLDHSASLGELCRHCLPPQKLLSRVVAVEAKRDRNKPVAADLLSKREGTLRENAAAASVEGKEQTQPRTLINQLYHYYCVLRNEPEF